MVDALLSLLTFVHQHFAPLYGAAAFLTTVGVGLFAWFAKGSGFNHLSTRMLEIEQPNADEAQRWLTDSLWPETPPTDPKERVATFMEGLKAWHLAAHRRESLLRKLSLVSSVFWWWLATFGLSFIFSLTSFPLADAYLLTGWGAGTVFMAWHLWPFRAIFYHGHEAPKTEPKVQAVQATPAQPALQAPSRVDAPLPEAKGIETVGPK